MAEANIQALGRAAICLRIGSATDKGVTCKATATVILPSREHGPVELPEPPAAHRARGARMMAEAAERHGISVAAVKVTLHRSLKALQALVGGGRSTPDGEREP